MSLLFIHKIVHYCLQVLFKNKYETRGTIKEAQIQHLHDCIRLYGTLNSRNDLNTYNRFYHKVHIDDRYF